MNLIQWQLTENRCYTKGTTIVVKGLMLHSVGTPQPRAAVFIESWNNPAATVSVHAFIEPGGTVYQTLPWNYRAWHCGGGANNTHIGVEMTEPATLTYTGGAAFTDGNPAATRAHVLATYVVAVELFAHLCRQYSLDPTVDGVILSHSEGYRRGVASNHGDVEHLWSRFGLTMGQFRWDVASALGGGSGTPGTQPDRNGCPYGSTTETVRLGSSGTAVKRCQWYLTALGFHTGPSGVDGIFGAATETALKRFQTAFGLQNDGVCGAGTWDALVNVYAVTFPPDPGKNTEEGLTMSQYTELKAMIEKLSASVSALEERHGAQYKTLADVPPWGREAVRDAISRGILSGVSQKDLSLSWTDVRMLVMDYRRERSK